MLVRGTVNIFFLISRGFCLLPLPVAMAFGRLVGLFWYYVLRIRRGTALRNVARVFGAEKSPAEQRAIVRECLVHFAQFGVEGFRLAELTLEQADQLLERGPTYHYLDEARAKGRGVIFATIHLGNFELMGCCESLRGVPLSVVVKDIQWKQARDFWLHIRSRTGYKMIAPRRSREDIRHNLANGEVVAFTIDQHMMPYRAIVCDFFGQLASTTPAPVRFAFETGAVIVPGVVFRDGPSGHHKIHMEPELELETPYDDLEANIRHNTERLNRIAEKWIRTWPSQWLWLHKRWKVQDDPRGFEIPPQLQHLLGNNTR